jgi:hypothetical protein
MADGISRLAFLEVGRRLHERGVLPDPLHALEGDPRELCKLLLMPETVDVPALAAGMAVSRPFPSWDRSISTEIYLCRACSCHEILRVETPGQVGSWVWRRAAIDAKAKRSDKGRSS